MATKTITMHTVAVECDRCHVENRDTNQDESTARAVAINAWGFITEVQVYKNVKSLNDASRRATSSDKMVKNVLLCPDCVSALNYFLSENVS